MKLRTLIFPHKLSNLGIGSLTRAVLQSNFTSGPNHIDAGDHMQISCWRCQKLIYTNQPLAYIQKYFCPCEKRVILPPLENKDYFEVYNLAPSYHIDKTLLKSNYLKLQYTFHPDRFSSHSEQEQEFAAEHSAIISTSYNTLSNRYSRAVYLLLLNGIDFEKDTVTSKMSPEFLIQMFETNEKLEEGMSESELTELKLETKQHIENCHSQLGPAFDEKDYVGAKDIAGRLQYFRNILLKIEEM